MEIEQIENYTNITTVKSMFLEFVVVVVFLLIHILATTCPESWKKKYCGKICTELSRLNNFNFCQFILKFFGGVIQWEVTILILENPLWIV